MKNDWVSTSARLACFASIISASTINLARADQKPAPAVENNTQSTKQQSILIDAKGIPTTWIQGNPITQWEKDKIYILEFWATWCGPCVAAMPHMQKLYAEYNDKNVDVMGINVWDKKTPEAIKNFLEKKAAGVKYPILLDGEAETAQRTWLKPLNITGIPAAIIIKNGQLLWQGHPAKIDGDLMSKIFEGKDVLTSVEKPKSNAEFREEKQAKLTTLKDLAAKKQFEQAFQTIQQWEKSKEINSDQAWSYTRAAVDYILDQGDKAQAQEALIKSLDTANNQNQKTLYTLSWILLNTRLATADRNLKFAQELIDLELTRTSDPAYKSALYGYKAQLDLLLGNKAEAVKDTEQAIAYSYPAKIYDEIKGQLQIKENIEEFIAKKVIPAAVAYSKEQQASPTLAQWDNQVKDNYFTPILEQVEWVQGPQITGLPKDQFVILDFWVPNTPAIVTQRDQLRGPSGILLKKLRVYGLHQNKNLHIATLIPNSQTTSERLKPILDNQFTHSDYPVGVAKDGLVWNDLMQKNGLKEAPTCLVAKNGKVIWAGETRGIPSWVADAIKTNATSEKLDQIVEHEKAFSQAERAEIKNYFQLVNDGKYDEAKKIVSDIEKRYQGISSFQSFVMELDVYLLLEQKKYQEGLDYINRVLTLSPYDNHLAARAHKALNDFENVNDGKSELSKNIEKTAIRAIDQLAKNEATMDIDYASSCYTLVAKMYAKEGENKLAEDYLIKAFATSPEVQQLIKIQSEN